MPFVGAIDESINIYPVKNGFILGVLEEITKEDRTADDFIESDLISSIGDMMRQSSQGDDIMDKIKSESQESRPERRLPKRRVWYTYHTIEEVFDKIRKAL